VDNTVQVYVTAKNTTDLLTKKNPIEFTIDTTEQYPSVTIDDSKTFQTIEGFGGAFTEAAASNFYKMSAKKQKEILKAYFDPNEGIGYTLCRTHMNSCDFSSGNYACDTVNGDVDFKYFTLENEKKTVIPFIKEAMSLIGSDFKLFISPWSPPKWMKTNDNMLRGGKLKPEYRLAWAAYYCKFIKELQKDSIPVWGLTVQNEPAAVQSWESCIYSAAEERDFVRDYLGPELHKQGLADVKLMIWDHNRDLLFNKG
jgi:glucosylceramidase